jgi:hypothetical protein
MHRLAALVMKVRRPLWLDALAENDPIFRNGWRERLESDAGLSQILGHRDFTAGAEPIAVRSDKI